MSISITRNFYILVTLLFISVFGFFISFKQVHAAAGDMAITVNQELGTGLVGAAVYISCPGNIGAIALVDAGAGLYTATGAEMGDFPDCDDTETISITVAANGYVTEEDSTTYNTGSDPDTHTVTGVQFAVKITPTREVSDDVLTGATVTAGSGPTACIESTGVYYCAVPTTEDDDLNNITISKSGYVTNTSYSTGNRPTNAQPQNEILASDILFQIKLCFTDELGNYYPNPDSGTFDGNLSSLRTGACDYFAQTGSNKAIVLTESGFIPSATTNTALADVSASAVGQTYIQLGNYSARSAAITAGSSVQIKGLVYKLKSDSLMSQSVGPEAGEAVTGIATGHDTDGTPSADVTISVSGGGSIIASAVADDVIYIAYDANGGGDDSFTVQVQNVTVGSGTSNGASLVMTEIIDLTNTISGTTTQLLFDIDDDGDEVLSADGFSYPLVISLEDELENLVTGVSVATKTYNSVAPYFVLSVGVVDNILVFANVASNASLVLNKSGYVQSTSTNTGLTDITTDQTAQTFIGLGSNSAYTSAIISGDDVDVKGFEFILKSETLKTETTGTITNIADGYDEDGGSPSADVAITASGGVTIIASQTVGDVIYIAATGNGGGNDTVSITLSNVTVGVGLSNGADLVVGSLTDSTNLISGATSQVSFDYAPSGSDADINNTTGFLFPLKVLTATDAGGPFPGLGVSPRTYDGVAAYAVAVTGLWFGNVGTNATLNLASTGYENAEDTNTGLTDVTTSQTVQTVITLGAHAAYSSAISAGESVNVKGFEDEIIVVVSSSGGGGVMILNVSTPITIPASGSYSDTQSVTLLSSGSMSIRYTTDGSVPTCSSGILYTGPFSVSKTMVVRAIGCGSSGIASSIASFSYAIGSSAQSGCVSGALFSSVTGQACVVVNDTPISFLSNLDLGSSSEDVRQLQIFLNSKGFTVASSGPGSVGNETIHFGPATRSALARYQTANNISPAVGYFGLMTRARVNAQMDGMVQSSVSLTQSSETLGEYVFNTNLQVGSSSEDVRQLQIFLNSKGFTVAESGPGSVGNETIHFGPATRSALARYQTANNISPAVGYFGLMTRARVNGSQ